MTPIHLSLLMLLAVASLAGCRQGGTTPGVESVRIGDRVFHLEVAADDATRAQGLMGRTSIAPDGGMLFIFPAAAERSFWMGHCLVDMDIMFLDGRGFVTAIHEMTVEAPQGETESDYQYELRLADYPSRIPAQFAIELQAGMIRTLNIRVQDKIALDLPRLKALAR
ncbi:MAG: DUF192 domain-containing protein [Phycisphaerales bacterium]|nr:DUF192 domain-containing protein [Phycisphaerales bacterium]